MSSKPNQDDKMIAETLQKGMAPLPVNSEAVERTVGFIQGAIAGKDRESNRVIMYFPKSAAAYALAACLTLAVIISGWYGAQSGFLSSHTNHSSAAITPIQQESLDQIENELESTISYLNENLQAQNEILIPIDSLPSPSRGDGMQDSPVESESVIKNLVSTLHSVKAQISTLRQSLTK